MKIWILLDPCQQQSVLIFYALFHCFGIANSIGKFNFSAPHLPSIYIRLPFLLLLMLLLPSSHRLLFMKQLWQWLRSINWSTTCPTLCQRRGLNYTGNWFFSLRRRTKRCDMCVMWNDDDDDDEDEKSSTCCQGFYFTFLCVIISPRQSTATATAPRPKVNKKARKFPRNSIFLFSFHFFFVCMNRVEGDVCWKEEKRRKIHLITFLMLTHQP